MLDGALCDEYFSYPELDERERETGARIYYEFKSIVSSRASFLEIIMVKIRNV